MKVRLTFFSLLFGLVVYSQNNLKKIRIPIAFHIVHNSLKDGDIEDEYFVNLKDKINEAFKNVVKKPNAKKYLVVNGCAIRRF